MESQLYIINYDPSPLLLSLAYEIVQQFYWLITKSGINPSSELKLAQITISLIKLISLEGRGTGHHANKLVPVACI